MRAGFQVEHDPFGKPNATFSDHALEAALDFTDDANVAILVERIDIVAAPSCNCCWSWPYKHIEAEIELGQNGIAEQIQSAACRLSARPARRWACPVAAREYRRLGPAGSRRAAARASPGRQAPARCQTTAQPSRRPCRELPHRDISARLGWLQGRSNASLHSRALMHCYCARISRAAAAMWRRGNRNSWRAMHLLAKKNRRPVRGGGLAAEGTNVPLFQFYQSTWARMPKPLIVPPSNLATGPDLGCVDRGVLVGVLVIDLEAPADFQGKLLAVPAR